MYLEEIRNEINCIDEQIVKLLEERMELVNQVAEIKKNSEVAIFDYKREQKILEGVASQVKNKRYEEAIVGTFYDIMKNSRKYQNKKLGSQE
ncbi:chorismate mutase [Lactovum miscens]|uniref:Monofunctional chorismate mutase n=1 Tax=Lactovum miscens TaxID=190387 RepID=A0A841C993_9LACT|nr:chorismate mutase [Lactovum miscens]MBB5887959.1 monofunctional chorismate mutase [Lactovum miscens]